MGKRRRDIKRRKRLQEGQEKVREAAEPIREEGIPEEEDLDLLDDDEVVTEPPSAEREEPAPASAAPIRQESPGVPVRDVSEAGWLGKNKENLLLGMLVLYVLLLGLGTIGELFEIEWILNLPIFR
ncbi:MAG: hypothetical protein JSV26_08245 [bacterium]|nr:MAG: hypothetical protein JSV26_08245 [bacterium]